jgi:hypothetical protein
MIGGRRLSLGAQAPGARPYRPQGSGIGYRCRPGSARRDSQANPVR